MFNQLRICVRIFLDDRLANLIQKRLVDTEQASVTRRAAQQAAQDIPTPFVLRQDSVADHKCGGTDMVGDDAQGNVRFRIRMVLHARDPRDMF